MKLLLPYWHSTTAGARTGAMATLKAVLVLSAFEAVAIGPVPIEWLGLAWLIIAGLFLLNYLRVPISIYALLGWAVAVQIINGIGCAYAWKCAYDMPPGATTSYPVYIALRYFSVLAFIAALGIATWLQDKREELVQFIIKLGTVIAVIALYVYVAELSGLPDIPRTRLGTDGQVVTEVAFSYAFHRALGTFREPSHLAAWMVLPFFLSLTKPTWKSLLMGTVLLLTGSLTGFVAIAFGGGMAWIYLLTRRVRGKWWLWKLPLTAALLIGLALIPFTMLSGESNLGSVIADRITPILEFGVRESNRGYVYDYAAESSIPILGEGLGNSTLSFTQWMRSDVVSGFLSLYVNALYSLGIAGLAILIVFLSRPLFGPLRYHAKEAWPLFAAYFAWLVMFSIHAAELPIMFAMTYALITARP